jgi:hypothetical protein
MFHKERTEEHVRGRPKDHMSNMQTEFHGTPKTRNSVCRRENAEAPKATEFRVSTGRRQSSKSYGIPCVGGKSPKPRKHENPCDRGKSLKRRKYGMSCDLEFRVVAKIQNSVFPRNNVEIPNSQNPATSSNTSGTQPELKTSKFLDIRKNGENQRPMQNRILEQVSSARRRTSGPTRRARNEGSYIFDADEAWSRKGSKPKTRRASS